MLQCILVSAIVSYLVSTLVAKHSLRVIDNYVRDMIELAKKAIADAYARSDGGDGV